MIRPYVCLLVQMLMDSVIMPVAIKVQLDLMMMHRKDMRIRVQALLRTALISTCKSSQSLATMYV